MAVNTERPSQYKQSSRKGKKAWRKNIDISEVETKIQEKQEQEITHGKQDLTEITNDALFQVDMDGDQILKEKLVKRKQIKKHLKSTEILDSIRTQSKVPALLNPKLANKKNDKIQGVSKKELHKLLALAGRKVGESKLKARVEKDGLVKSNSFDLWGVDPKEEIKVPSGIKIKAKKDEIHKVPKEMLKQSTTGWSIATVTPSSFTRETEIVKEIEVIPHSGKSYNPSKENWSDLIQKEYKTEVVNEQRRIALEQYKERIQHLMETLDDNEEEDSESDEEAKEDSIDLQSEDENSSEVLNLSVNPVTENRKKTKYQRNKQKRHEAKVKLQQELKNLKAHVKELERLEEIQEEVQSKAPSKHSTNGKTKKNKKHKLGTKHSVMEDNLEIKFSDELSDSLRKLKPEGNHLYDAVRKLQGSGKVESRIPIRKGRRYKQKITEKWTYKDFK